MLTIGSLFSGIGGLELGLEQSGLGPVVWQVELEPTSRAVLAEHWPGVPIYADVHAVGAHNLAPVDLICGGFPCQDISLAGSGKGLAGARSGLWHQFARVIRECRPSWVVIENVAGGAKRWVDAVADELGQQGYATIPLPISAEAVGAPHRRARIFMVARRVSDTDGSPLRLEQQRGPARWSGGLRDSTEPIAAFLGRGMADAISVRGPCGTGDQPSVEHLPQGRASRYGGREHAVADSNGVGCELERLADRQPHHSRTSGDELDGCDLPTWPPAADDLHAWRTVPPYAQPSICGLADGFPAGLVGRKHKLKALGNAVVPACAEVAGHFIQLLLDADDAP